MFEVASGRGVHCATVPGILRKVSLQAGTRLGPYEIVAAIGAGGMGEVYRARDPRIGRDVALKILPRAFADNPDRLRRFEQEARAAGALNHPNLLTLFDLGTHDGTPYIVSELLEGENLRQRLPLPQRKAAALALQIASGVAAAHDRGIIHRDLKPENIFVTSDEHVKILDFGLARIMLDADAPEQSSTVERITDPGVVMGTASYMSPEQVRGQPADHRSDIFSFGAVLTEMLTGKHPFHREAKIETLNAIIKEDPAISPGAVPPALERILLHALEKNPAQRFQSMRDVAFALETFSGSGESAPISAPQKVRRAEKRVEKRPVTFSAVSFRRGYVMSARLARDGSVVYGAAWEDRPLELFASFPGDPQTRAVGIGDADILSVSPTTGELAVSLGRHFVLGWISSGTLARVPLAGGAPREIAEDVQDADWSRDGKNLAVIRRAGDQCVIEYPLGHRIYETPHWISNLRFSPKGDLLAFLDHPLWGDDGGSVVAINLDGEKKMQSRFWDSTSGLVWSPKGDEVCTAGHGASAGRDLVAVNLSGKERILLPMAGRLTVHDMSPQGDVLVASEAARREILFGLRGTPGERNLSWFDWSYMTDLSADGSRILIEEQGSAAVGGHSIYLRKTDGSPAVHLGEGVVRAISPDGKWVVARPGGADRLELLSVGVGEPRTVPVHGMEMINWWYWFPDGKRLLIWGNEPGHGNRMYELLIEGDGHPRPVTPEGIQWHCAIAPDGSGVIAAGPDQKLALFSTTGDAPAREVAGSRLGDLALMWGKDNGLYVTRAGRVQTAIERIDLATAERSLWQEIKPADPAGVTAMYPVYVAADLGSYAYCFRRFLSELYLVNGVF